MTVLVTGANGHLGGALVRELLSRGQSVRALVHHGNDALEGLDIERVPGSMTDEASLRAAVAGCDVVYHLAAVISITGRDEPVLTTVNVEGAGRMAQVCLESNVRRLVHFSSIHALSQYPEDRAITEDNEPAKGAGFLPYDRSKAAGEAQVHARIKQGLDAVIVNPVGCIGPHDYRPSRMGQVLLDLYHRRLPALVDGGYTWVDTRDVALGAIAAAEKGRTGERYILASHYGSVSDIGKWAEAATGKKSPGSVTPIWMAKIGVPFSMTWAAITRTEPKFTFASLHALASNKAISNQKAKEELGFDPRPVPETIADTYAWFRERGVLPK